MVVISDPTVSGHHAVIIISDDTMVIEDLGSTNGTYINGEKIDMPYKLEDGLQIMVGLCRLIYSMDKPVKEKPRFSSGDYAAQPGSQISTVGFQDTMTSIPAYLEFTKGLKSGKDKVELDKTVNPIGSLGVGVASVSYGKRGWVLSHVDGMNPLLNGDIVTSKPVLLKDGDVITIGEMEVRFIRHMDED